MIANIELTYGASSKILELSPENYRLLRDKIPQMSLPEECKELWRINREFLADLTTDGQLLTELGLTFEVVGNATGQAEIPTTAPVHIHISNIGLMSIRQVIVLNDCCTEELDEMLQRGWYIIAVCPPNVQRRPDYVLGRYERDDRR